MTNYNISGLTPAKTGGATSFGENWFLFDKSGVFTVDKDLDCTIYLVGGGANGSSGYGTFYGGDGGNGGCVNVISQKIPKNTDCIVNIAPVNDITGTTIKIGETILACNGEGYIQRTGGLGAYTYVTRVPNKGIYGCVGRDSSAGQNGIETPYGWVGSSGGGGASAIDLYPYPQLHGSYGGNGAGGGGETSNQHLSSYYPITRSQYATNYGCGGGGGFSDRYDYYSVLPDGVHRTSGGGGKGGCVIVCVKYEKLKKPSLQDVSYNYDGTVITPVINDYNEFVMSKSGTVSGVSIGKYQIIVSLKDPENTVWEDGTTDDIILEWEIKPITATKPSLTTANLEYSASAQNVQINGFNSDYMTKTGTEQAIKAGVYSIVFSLKDTSSSAWDNGDGTTSTDDIILEWEITKKILPIPKLTATEFIYTGSNCYAPLDSNFNSTYMNYTGSTSGLNAGVYNVVISLKDVDSSEWEDGTSENKTLNWKIIKRIDKVGFPTISPNEFVFDNTKKQPLFYYGANSGAVISSGTISAIAACGADPYEISFSLKTNNNITYVWEDGTTEDYILTWRINKAILPLPTIEQDTFVYNGRNTTVNVSSYSTNLVTRTGTTTVSNAKAGEYTVSYALKDTTSSEWEDGTTEEKRIIWRINKAQFDVPTAKNTSLEVIPSSVHFQSSAKTQYLDLDGYDSAIMTVSGNSGAYPNLYIATFKLKDISSASWTDGTVEDKTIEWEITKTEYLVKKPSLKESEFQYNGLTKTVSFNDRNDNIMNISSETSGVSARTYKAVASLKDSNVYNFKWDDGTTSEIGLPWEIKKSIFTKPTLSTTSFDYNGLSRSISVNGFNSNVMEYGEIKTFSAIAAGRYSIIVSLKDKNSASWEDGSTKDVVLEWQINPIKVDIPTVTNTEFTYDGRTKIPTIQGYNSNIMILRGARSAVDAGQYVITFTLKDTFSSTWNDGTTEEKRFRWIINKADYSVNKPYLSAAEFTYNGYTHVFYCSNGSYTQSRGYVYNYVRNVSSTSMSVGGTLRASSAGEHIITVNLKPHKNYNFKWSDGTTAPLELKWTINKAVFDIPTISSDIFYFGGKIPEKNSKGEIIRYRYGNESASVSGFNAWVMTASGITTGYYDCYFEWTDTSAEYYENSRFYTATHWQLGKYYARFYLKDPASATWSDGTNGEITLEWTIVREVILLERPYLQSSSFEYDGTIKKPVIINDAGGLVKTGTFEEAEIGNYAIVASLYRNFTESDTKDYRWDDNTTEDIVVMNWNIWGSGKIAIPCISPTCFEYNGNKKDIVISGFDENTMIKSGVFSATNAGEYSVTFSLKHPNSVSWSDGTTSDKILSWKIIKGTAYIPYLNPDDLMYDGNSHPVAFREDDTRKSYVVYNYNEALMICGGDLSAIAAGDYKVIVSLKDKSSCTWSNGTTDPIELPYTVSKKTVLLDIPYLKDAEFLYDGTSKTPEILFSANGMKITGDITAIKAGLYKITISLVEDKNITYLWSDHSSNDIELFWEIKGRISGDASDTNGIEKPFVEDCEFIYDSTIHAPAVYVYEKDMLNRSGTISAIDAGEYEIRFSLKDKESCTWADGTTDDFVVAWVIKKAKIEKPLLVNGEFLYNGAVQSPIFDNLDEKTIAKSGDREAVLAGNYIIKIAPDRNHLWADSTADELSFDWTIKKFSFSLPTLIQGNFIFNGLSQEPIFEGFDENVMVKKGDIQGFASGNYTITIAFKDENSSEWKTTNDSLEKSFSWSIEVASLDYPIMITNSFPYDGLRHEPNLENFIPEMMDKAGDMRAVAAGDYELVVSLKYPNSSKWESRTKNSNVTDKKYKWKITKSQFDFPTVTDLHFLYDGKEHAPNISEYNENIISIAGTPSAINAGDYCLKISLKDPNSAYWTDNTTEEREINWDIEKVTLEKPYLTYNEFNYNGGIHSPTVKGLDVSRMTVSGEQSGIGAGVYYVLVPLLAPNNYKWTDGSSEPLSLEWIIHGKPIDKPYLKKNSFKYDGIEHTPTILGYKTDAMNKSGDLNATSIGEYVVIISLKDNYEWSDGGFSPLELPWSITKEVVVKPTVTDTEFTYDKNIHSPKISSYNKNTITTIGTLSERNAGEYSIIFSLKDKKNASWEDGTKDDIIIPWAIHKKSVIKPTLINVTFVYNGGKQSPKVVCTENALYVGGNANNVDISNLLSRNYLIYYFGYNSAIDANNYFLRFNLTDSANYEWEDGSIAPVVLDWTIKKKPIQKPYLDYEQFFYSGETKRVTVIGYDNRKMTYLSPIYGDYPNPVFSAVQLGEYEITIGLFVTRYITYSNGYAYATKIYNYEWDDGDTSTTLTLKWRIIPCELDYPYLIKDEYIYTGNSIRPSVFGYNYKIMSPKGDMSAINAGNYGISYVLIDTKNYKWKEGVIEGKVLPWRINKAKLSKTKLPYLKNNLIYTSSKQSPHWLDYDIRKFKIGGTNEAINVGVYYTEFTPTDNYTWEDGTTTPITRVWKIEKLGLSIPKQSQPLYYNGERQSPQWINTLNHLNNIKITGETYAINVGEYYVNFECDDNCYFIDTGNNRCNTYWKIKKRICYKLVGEKYRYTGELIQSQWHAVNIDALRISGQTSGINVGEYIAKFEIIDPANNRWADWIKLSPGGNGAGIQEVPWYIVDDGKYNETKNKVPIPYQSNYLVYNGEKQSPEFAGYNKDKMILIGGIPSEIDAGIYYVTFKLKSGYVWVDNTTEEKTVPWRIYPQKVPFPYILTSESDGTGMYYYELEGKRYPIWVKYRPEIMTMTGDTYDVDFSWHTTNFELKDKKNYEWIKNNDAYEVYPVTWKLSRAYKRDPVAWNGRKVRIPRQANRPIEDGTTKYPKWGYYDNTAIHNLGGEWEGVIAGKRYVILELVPGYIWEDNTDEIKAVPWWIYEVGEKEEGDTELIPIPIPNQIYPPYYNGRVQYPEWDIWADYGFDVVWGTLMEVPAGQYKIKLRLKTGYIWEDGTTEDKIVTWVILPYEYVEEDEPIEEPIVPKKPEPEIEEQPEDIIHGENCCCCCCTGSITKDDEGIADKSDIDDLFANSGIEYDIGEDYNIEDIASESDIDDLFT